MNSKQLQAFDKLDPLASYRDEFLLPDGVCYLDGNSLGPVSQRVKTRVQTVLDEQWQPSLIASWNDHGWIDLPRRVGDQLAGILGADEGQVICCDSTSVNLFKAIAAALSLAPNRTKVLTTDDNFPTDRYMIGGLTQLMGERCELVSCPESSLEEALQDDIAVVVLTQVNFRTGELLDMGKLTELAHRKGCLVVWDLAHSAGVVPIQLDASSVDFAVGCTYKFLNAGPGAPAFIYAAKRHLAQLKQPLSGWLGHNRPFDFNPNFEAHSGIEQFLCGTPAVISMSAVEAALSLFERLDVTQLRVKSQSLMKIFLALLEDVADANQLKLVGPDNFTNRGSQLSFEHENAYGLCQALIKRGVIGDFRAPNLLRFGFSPLYLSYQDMGFAIQQLAACLAANEASLPENNQRSAVT